MRCGRAGCPLYPGGDGVPRDHRDVRDRRLPPCNGWPLPPRCCTPTRDVKLTRHQQGFRVIHPSGLPLTCSTRSERAPSGFPLSFAPGRYQPRTSGRGRVWNTDPKSRLRHHAEPPIDEPTHNVRPRVAPSSIAAWSACGTSSGQDHSGWAGIIEANEQNTFPPLPCDRYQAAGHPLRDLPAHRGVPARQPQCGPDRALPPGPSRSARRPFTVALRPGLSRREGTAAAASSEPQVASDEYRGGVMAAEAITG